MIRLCGPADATAMTELCAQLGHPCTEDRTLARLMKQLSDTSYGTWIAEDSSGASLGMLSGHIVHHIEQPPTAHLLALVVEKRAQGRGASTELMAVFDQWAREAGAERAIVHSGDHRRGSHRGYEQYNFEPDGLRYVKSY